MYSLARKASSTAPARRAAGRPFAVARSQHPASKCNAVVVAKAQSGAPQETVAPLDVGRRALLLGVALVGSQMLIVPVSGAASITKVFVAGSTGETGRRVVQQLRKQGLAVRAGVRDPKKALALGYGADAGIEVVTADVTGTQEQLVAAIGDAQAVICATGFKGSLFSGGSGSVDEQGTINLVNAAKAAGASKFVLVSSLLTNARAAGQQDNPNYKFLQLLGGVLEHKLVAEKYIRASGLDYTIIRPGGLSNEPESAIGNLVLRNEDSLFGLDGDPGRQISRDTVAAVAVAALGAAGASNRVVEIVASPSAPKLPEDKWFA